MTWNEFANIVNNLIDQYEATTEGIWFEENSRPRSSQFQCSQCGEIAYYPQPTRDKDWKKHCPYKYCPNCGAKMKGNNKNEN